MYLGYEIYNIINLDGVECVDFSSEKYVTAAVNNMEDNLDKNNARLTSKQKTPFQSGYCPKLNVNVGLKDDCMQYYQEFIV